jgi:uncharacterized membrane protein
VNRVLMMMIMMIMMTIMMIMMTIMMMMVVIVRGVDLEDHADHAGAVSRQSGSVKVRSDDDNCDKKEDGDERNKDNGDPFRD